MKKREIDTAARFGLIDRLQALENDLTAIPGTTYIDFDLSGLYDRCPLCFVVGYDIDVRREDCFEARREWLKSVIMVFSAHDLKCWTASLRPLRWETASEYQSASVCIPSMSRTRMKPTFLGKWWRVPCFFKVEKILSVQSTFFGTLNHANLFRHVN